MSALTRCTLAPIQERTMRPPFSPASIMRATMLEGVAKPMPIEPPLREKIAVLMPNQGGPSIDTRAPPELPGLIAASVWMKKPFSVTPLAAAGQRRDDA